MATLLTLAIAPVMALMFYFYRRDRLEPEPRRKVLKVMFLGALSTIPAVFLEVSYGDAPADHGLLLAFYTFLIVAASEELCKFGAVLVGIYNDPEFDEPFDGVVYCVAASLGFAALENLGYVLSQGTGVGILRALLSVPGHALFGAVAGYFVGVSRFAGGTVRIAGVFTGLTAAIVMHGIYDYCCFESNPLINLCVLPLMGFYWWLALRLMKRLQS